VGANSIGNFMYLYGAFKSSIDPQYHCLYLTDKYMIPFIDCPTPRIHASSLRDFNASDHVSYKFDTVLWSEFDTMFWSDSTQAVVDKVQEVESVRVKSGQNIVMCGMYGETFLLDTFDNLHTQAKFNKDNVSIDIDEDDDGELTYTIN
jgi:hypothetical protein